MIKVQKLYSIEKWARKLELSFEDWFILRKKRSTPVLRKLKKMYSFFGTCKAQGLEPFEWMKSMPEKMPDYDARLIEKILPIKKS